MGDFDLVERNVLFLVFQISKSDIFTFQAVRLSKSKLEVFALHLCDINWQCQVQLRCKGIAHSNETWN